MGSKSTLTPLTLLHTFRRSRFPTHKIYALGDRCRKCTEPEKVLFRTRTRGAETSGGPCSAEHAEHSKSGADSNLRDDGADPDADEERIAVESVEDVPLSVNLARVDLVEQRHHDERVEDDGEVLRWRRVQRHLPAAVDVE